MNSRLWIKPAGSYGEFVSTHMSKIQPKHKSSIIKYNLLKINQVIKFRCTNTAYEYMNVSCRLSSRHKMLKNEIINMDLWKVKDLPGYNLNLPHKKFVRISVFSIESFKHWPNTLCQLTLRRCRAEDPAAGHTPGQKRRGVGLDTSLCSAFCPLAPGSFKKSFFTQKIKIAAFTCKTNCINTNTVLE